MPFSLFALLPVSSGRETLRKARKLVWRTWSAQTHRRRRACRPVSRTMLPVVFVHVHTHIFLPFTKWRVDCLGLTLRFYSQYCRRRSVGCVTVSFVTRCVVCRACTGIMQLGWGHLSSCRCGVQDAASVDGRALGNGLDAEARTAALIGLPVPHTDRGGSCPLFVCCPQLPLHWPALPGHCPQSGWGRKESKPWIVIFQSPRSQELVLVRLVHAQMEVHTHADGVSAHTGGRAHTRVGVHAHTDGSTQGGPRTLLTTWSHCYLNFANWASEAFVLIHKCF